MSGSDAVVANPGGAAQIAGVRVVSQRLLLRDECIEAMADLLDGL